MLTPDGLVGRVIRVGASVSSALLVTDPNSRVPVLGRKHRSVGILFGQGPKNELILRYANQNAPLEAGEVLVTSGQARIFPKGLPVARVTRVDRSEIDLHLFVTARPLVDLDRLEEVLLLMPDAQWEAEEPFVDKFEGG